MPIEYEAKVLGIDPGVVADRILALGGLRVGEHLLRRYVYDIAAADESRWIRLRDTGSEVTLTVKEIAHDGIDGTTETEVVVSDFDTTNELLGKIGYRPKSYQENRRTSFTLDGAQLELDRWPGLPPYLEIESHSRDHVVTIAAALGYPEHDLTGENTTRIYARHGIDLTRIQNLRFAD